jgi:hypothetical protein
MAPTIAEGCPLACTTSQSARSGVAEGWPPGPTFREIIRIGLRLAASPLVLVATNTRLPLHTAPSAPLCGSSALLFPKLCCSSCQPYANSALVMFLPYRYRQIASQIPLPTMHTASGLYFKNFWSSCFVPALISSLLSSAAFFDGRSTMLVLPKQYSAGRLLSSSGLRRRSVKPEARSSFQKWFEGCA